MEQRRLRIVPCEPRVRDAGATERYSAALDQECLKARVRAFTERVSRLAESLPMTGAAGLCGDELLQSADLIRTNCEAALRAASEDELLERLRVVEEETRDCKAWLELLVAAEVSAPQRPAALMLEADELVAATARFVRRAGGDSRRRSQRRRPRLRLTK